MFTIPFAASPFDDDDSDNDAEAISRRPVAGHHGARSQPDHIGDLAMRVLHLDCGREWRGGQAQVLMLMEGLAPRGIVNQLMAPAGPLLERAQARGFECERWSPQGDWDLVALVRAAARLGALRPDVVHCHDARSHAIGVPAARIAGAPAVVVSRRVTFRVAANPFSALKYRLPVDRYLCVSRAVSDELRAAGLAEQRLSLVPDAFECRATSPAVDLRALLGLPRHAPVIGTAAALTPEKGHAHLLEAAVQVIGRCSEAHFVWMGEGCCRDALVRRRAELGLESRVHLLGHRADAQALLSQCTMCALASIEEGLGTSLIEAQALGVPVVATAVGGVPEIVADGKTGRLVPARQPAAMAAALIEALESADLRQRWSEAGRLAARAYDVDHMVDRTLEIYRSILSARSDRTG